MTTNRYILKSDTGETEYPDVSAIAKVLPQVFILTRNKNGSRSLKIRKATLSDSKVIIPSMTDSMNRIMDFKLANARARQAGERELLTISLEAGSLTLTGDLYEVIDRFYLTDIVRKGWHISAY